MKNLVEPITSEKLLTIPNFGLKSTVYDYGFSSKITPKLATQIVIANQARDTGGVKQFSEDVLSYQSMNIGISLIDFLKLNSHQLIAKKLLMR
jgi:hypothetical protein